MLTSSTNSNYWSFYDTFFAILWCRLTTTLLAASGRSPRRCEPCPPALISPICGSDGKLYKDACDMKSARCWLNKEILEVPWNECKANCNAACTLEFTPVCGEDGKIYNGNRCTFLWESCGKPTPLKEAPMATCEKGNNNR